MYRIGLLSVLGAAGFWIASLSGQPGAAPRPYGLDKRLPLTTSRVVGAPDPLPPYRAERAFVDLKLKYPIAVAHQPGSNRLLLINEEWSYGPVKIERIVDDSKTSEVET